MNFGARLRRARRLRNVTQDQLAEKCGVTKSAVSQWESNATRPHLDQLEQIGRELHVSLDALVYGAEPMLSPEAQALGRRYDRMSESQRRKLTALILVASEGVPDDEVRRTIAAEPPPPRYKR